MTMECNTLQHNNKVCKYLQLKDILVNQIEKGYFKVGERLPSEVHFASQFNVSKMTARQAMQELENEGYVDRSQGKGTFIRRDYAGKKNLELMVISPSMNMVSAESSLFGILKGIMIEGYICQVNIQFINLGKDHLLPAKLKSEILLAPMPDREMLYHYKKMALQGYKIFLINRVVDDVPGISYFSTDHYNETFDATNYLIRKGHREICFVGACEERWPHITARLQGYAEALRNNGLNMTEGLTVKLDDALPSELEKVMQERLAKILSLKRPTALVVAEGYRLQAVLDTLYELNFKLPDDIEIMTFNKVPDHIKEKVFIHEIEEQFEEMGRLAVRNAIAVNAGNSSKSCLVPAKLHLKQVQI